MDSQEKPEGKATRRAFWIGFLATVLFYGSCQRTFNQPTEMTSASTSVSEQ